MWNYDCTEKLRLSVCFVQSVRHLSLYLASTCILKADKIKLRSNARDTISCTLTLPGFGVVTAKRPLRTSKHGGNVEFFYLFYLFCLEAKILTYLTLKFCYMYALFP